MLDTTAKIDTTTIKPESSIVRTSLDTTAKIDTTTIEDVNTIMLSKLAEWIVRLISIHIQAVEEQAADAARKTNPDLDEYGRVLFANPGYGTC